MTRPLFLLVAGVLAACLTAGALAPLPSSGAPAYALGARVVWHAEVAAALFALAYGAIVIVWLAFHGTTLTRLGSSGIEIPQVGMPSQAEELASAHAELAATVEGLQARLAALQPDDVWTDPAMQATLGP